jgi:hypothetical protein
VLDATNRKIPAEMQVDPTGKSRLVFRFTPKAVGEYRVLATHKGNFSCTRLLIAVDEDRTTRLVICVCWPTFSCGVPCALVLRVACLLRVLLLTRLSVFCVLVAVAVMCVCMCVCVFTYIYVCVCTHVCSCIFVFVCRA